MTNMVAVFLPASGTLHAQLRTRNARDAIAAGMSLYTDGSNMMLLPQPRPGWHPMAVTLRDIDPSDDETTDEVSA